MGRTGNRQKSNTARTPTKSVAIQSKEDHERCPTRRILNIIGAKWTLAILPLLRERPMRNNELLRTIVGVSQRVLTETLRHLERHGLVARHDYETLPRHVEYKLTPLGESLAAAFAGLNSWVEEHYAEVNAAKEQHDRMPRRKAATKC